MNNSSIIWNVIGWVFGIVFVSIGAINIGWGNDPGYGVFILILSLAFFPPANAMFEAKTVYRIHPVLKVLLGLFIIWSALGVAELPDKINMLMKDLSYLENLTYEEII